MSLNYPTQKNTLLRGNQNLTFRWGEQAKTSQESGHISKHPDIRPQYSGGRTEISDDRIMPFLSQPSSQIEKVCGVAWRYRRPVQSQSGRRCKGKLAPNINETDFAKTKYISTLSRNLYYKYEIVT